VIEKMRELKALGLGLSLDDFGTGYSSLKYLSILPVDYIKIDQSFVRDMIPNKSKNCIIIAVIAIARSLGIRVISEGVETIHQFEYLTQEGSSLFQGFYFSEPVPVRSFEEA
jgi:EAL domain-containing protein (putative c-di-GMP-specific phosphodiesterase class I)